LKLPCAWGTLIVPRRSRYTSGFRRSCGRFGGLRRPQNVGRLRYFGYLGRLRRFGTFSRLEDCRRIETFRSLERVGRSGIISGLHGRVFGLVVCHGSVTRDMGVVVVEILERRKRKMT
jgi:hypothetical protein